MNSGDFVKAKAVLGTMEYSDQLDVGSAPIKTETSEDFFSADNTIHDSNQECVVKHEMDLEPAQVAGYEHSEIGIRQSIFVESENSSGVSKETKKIKDVDDDHALGHSSKSGQHDGSSLTRHIKIEPGSVHSLCECEQFTGDTSVYNQGCGEAKPMEIDEQKMVNSTVGVYEVEHVEGYGQIKIEDQYGTEECGQVKTEEKYEREGYGLIKTEGEYKIERSGQMKTEGESVIEEEENEIKTEVQDESPPDESHVFSSYSGVDGAENPLDRNFTQSSANPTKEGHEDYWEEALEEQLKGYDVCTVETKSEMEDLDMQRHLKRQRRSLKRFRDVKWLDKGVQSEGEEPEEIQSSKKNRISPPKQPLLHYTSRSPTPPQSPQKSQALSTPPAPQTIDMQDYVMQSLEDIRMEIRFIKRSLQEILSHLKKTEEIDLDDDDVIDDMFPLSSEDAMQNLEEKLNDPKYCKKILHFLCLIGGRNLPDTIKRMLNAIVKPSLSERYTVHGKNGKKAFKDLKLFPLICKAIRSTSKLENVQDTHIFSTIGKWLAGSRDRDGGRSRRK